IIPVTNDDARLFLKLKNGDILKGEDNINRSVIIRKEGLDKLYFEPAVAASQKAIQHILEADLILIGPGGFYTSVLPNLLAAGISKAIKDSKATVIYNCNLTNKNGQTDGFSLDDYAKEINARIGAERLDFVTYNSKKPDRKLIEKYQNSQQQLVEFDPEEIKDRSYKVIRADILSDEIAEYSSADVVASTRALIRHDSNKLAKIIFLLSEIEDYKSIIKDII
ncbi:MAG: 2-phospho-L-lactate transferase CofD family protein, partial [bacterium]|nr:2-phospho-L-lactate transferase CofD family protein [bacterium]